MKTFYSIGSIVLICMTLTLFHSCELPNKKIRASKGESVNVLMYEIPDFDEIQINCASDVVYVAGSGAPTIIVTAKDSTSRNVIIKVVEHKLCIGIRDGTMCDSLHLEIHGAPLLEDIELQGAACMKVEGALTPRNLDIDCNGASTIEINKVSCAELNIDCFGASFVNISNIICDDIDVDCNGAATVKLNGRSQVAKYEANGASSIDASAFDAVKIEKMENNGASSILK